MALSVPVSWLNDYVVTSDPNALAERLTLAGLEIEMVDTIGAHWEENLFLIAEILEVLPHPNADQLSLVKVNYGPTEQLQVVCGAPNLRCYENKEIPKPLKGALALPGAVLVESNGEEEKTFVLKPARIRGILSEGVLCSEKELGLSDDHEGVMLFSEDEFPVGASLKTSLGDTIFHFDIKGGFSHLLAMFGIAREVAALTETPLNQDILKKLSLPTVLSDRSGGTSQTNEIAEHPSFVKLEIENSDLCGRYSGLLIDGVRVGPSPFWVRQRLLRAGMRPINNIVDITNYVMLEMGQPLHAFDYDLLKERAEGRQPMIRVRRAQSGERMTTLDGVEHEFDDQMLLITDAKGPVAIAGIMGGAETEVSSTTKRILLESANFEFLNNRRTCQLLKLRTEASERFGKRLDPELTLKAAVRAARLMEEYAGGFLNSAYGDLYLKKRESIEIELDPLYVNRLLGVDLSRGEIVKILERLAFQVVVRDKLQVTVPSHRMDVRLAADLVEEVARVYGYNRMPGTLMNDVLPKTRPSASQRNAQLSGTEKVRDIIVETGLDEIITYSIVDPQDEARLVPDEQKELQIPPSPLAEGGVDPSHSIVRKSPSQKGGWEPSRYLALQNPLSAERTHMRQSLIPGALTTTKRNLRFKERVAVFEIGNIYQPREGELLPDEIPYLTILMTGKRLPPSWLDGAKNSQSPCPPLQKEGVSQSEHEDKLDFYDLKGVLVTLMEGLHIRKTSWQKSEGGIYHPGRSAAIMIEGEILGQMGEIHPKVVRCFGLPEQPVCVAEFELKALLRHWNQIHMMIEMPIYAPIYEDLAFVVDESIPAGQVESLILQTGHPLLEKVHLFDVFRGKRVGSNKKSLAFSMTYQAFDRTLTDEDVEPIREKIIQQLKQELNAELRV